MRFNILVFFSGLVLLSCGQSAKTQTEVNNEAKPLLPVIPAKYEIYFIASRTPTNPPDEITIDSNGQMVTLSQQLMADGKWKTPKGLARLEPEDKIVLDSLVFNDLLYSIMLEDVIPPCPNGSTYVIKIERKDRKEVFSLETNACAITENTLSATQRPVFRRLIQLFESMRVKYRPRFHE